MLVGTPRPLNIAFCINEDGKHGHDPSDMSDTKGLLSLARAAKTSGAALFSLGIDVRATRGPLDAAQYGDLAASLREASEGGLLFQLDLCVGNSSDASELQSLLVETAPDACQFSLEALLPGDGDENHEHFARDLLDFCEEKGIAVQFSLSSPSFIDWFYAYRQYGIIPSGFNALTFRTGSNPVGGAKAAHASRPQDLLPFLARLEKHRLNDTLVWSAAATGPLERSVLTAAIALGGHIATGTAYNWQNVDGEPFHQPQDQLLPLCEIAERLGRPTASVAEARALLFAAS